MSGNLPSCIKEGGEAEWKSLCGKDLRKRKFFNLIRKDVSERFKGGTDEGQALSEEKDQS